MKNPIKMSQDIPGKYYIGTYCRGRWVSCERFIRYSRNRNRWIDVNIAAQISSYTGDGRWKLLNAVNR